MLACARLARVSFCEACARLVRNATFRVAAFRYATSYIECMYVRGLRGVSVRVAAALGVEMLAHVSRTMSEHRRVDECILLVPSDDGLSSFNLLTH